MTSGTSCFDRAGRRFVTIERDAIAVVDLARSETRRIECTDARAVAAFDQQLWIATAADQLVRMDYTGGVLGPPVALDFAAAAVLVPAACGAPAAMWASAPAQMMVEDLSRVVCERVDADVAIPLTGRRHVIARGARLVLPSKLETALLPGTTVLGGMVTFDGKSVVLLASHGGARQLVIVSLGAGQVVQRCAAPGMRVRVATQRLVAISQLEPRRLWAIDLRTGRELGNVSCDDDVHDFAISPDGETLVTHAAGCIELRQLAALFNRRQAVRVDALEEVPDAAPVPVPVPAPVELDSEVGGGGEPQGPSLISIGIAAPAALVVPPLHALAPREVPPAIDRDRARQQLDQELASVALWTLRAIAVGWDTRRIGYGNEGRHPFELEVAAILGLTAGHATDHLTTVSWRRSDRSIACGPMAERSRSPTSRGSSTCCSRSSAPRPRTPKSTAPSSPGRASVSTWRAPSPADRAS